MRLNLAAVSVLCLSLAAATASRADFSAEEVNFIFADRDGDLLLDQSEYLQNALGQFSTIDINKDNKLSHDEVGELAKDKEFLDGDTDKDGALSITEVIAEKLADFESADTNGDGSLNVEEVTKFKPGQ